MFGLGRDQKVGNFVRRAEGVLTLRLVGKWRLDTECSNNENDENDQWINGSLEDYPTFYCCLNSTGMKPTDFPTPGVGLKLRPAKVRHSQAEGIQKWARF